MADQSEPIPLLSENAKLRGRTPPSFQTVKTLDPRQVVKESKQIVTARFDGDNSRSTTMDLAQRNVLMLDVLALTLAGLEAAHELGMTSWEQILKHRSKWSELTGSLAGLLEVEKLLVEIQKYFPQMVTGTNSTGPLEPSLEQAADIAKTLVSSFSVEEMAELARSNGDHELAHRCRVAHSRLGAIIYRIREGSKHRLAVAGRAFIEGRISAGELANFLELNISDAIALLESSHYVRSRSAIQLSEEQRLEHYSKLRKRRLSGDIDLLNERAIRREVLASNRIEGIGLPRWPSKKT